MVKHDKSIADIVIYLERMHSNILHYKTIQHRDYDSLVDYVSLTYDAYLQELRDRGMRKIAARYEIKKDEWKVEK